MKLRPFNITEDFEIMTWWLNQRQHPIPDSTETPEWGCIVEEDGERIACGFIRQVEGGYGQIDGFATNPKASSAQRHRAQDMMTTKLIKYAKHKGIKCLISNSQYTSTIKRAIKHGFEVLPHALFALDLRSL